MSGHPIRFYGQGPSYICSECRAPWHEECNACAAEWDHVCVLRAGHAEEEAEKEAEKEAERLRAPRWWSVKRFAAIWART